MHMAGRLHGATDTGKGLASARAGSLCGEFG
jgi:hypothetical protein